MIDAEAFILIIKHSHTCIGTSKDVYLRYYSHKFVVMHWYQYQLSRISDSEFKNTVVVSAFMYQFKHYQCATIWTMFTLLNNI